MRDLPDIALAIVFALILAWMAAVDSEETNHTPMIMEVTNGHTKTQPLRQTEVKPAPTTRLLDSEGVGDERPRTR